MILFYVVTFAVGIQSVEEIVAREVRMMVAVAGIPLLGVEMAEEVRVGKLTRVGEVGIEVWGQARSWQDQ